MMIVTMRANRSAKIATVVSADCRDFVKHCQANYEIIRQSGLVALWAGLGLFGLLLYIATLATK